MPKAASGFSNVASDLWNHFFIDNNYNKHVRPVLNMSTQTVVSISLSLVAIVDFNDVEETFTVTAILSLSWTDEFFTWEPVEFGNLNQVNIPQNYIWKPHIALENSITKVE